MTIQLVVIADENNGIGKNNRLLAHLPADLKHFKRLTLGFPVIMGRKTYDSIGKPLPGRRNIIVSKQNLVIEGCEVVHSLDEAYQLCEGSELVSVIGGATIYQQSIAQADKVYLTRLHHQFDADAFFPPIGPDHWKETERTDFDADEKNPYPYSFITYSRS